MALMTSVDIGYYLYGLYALKFDPPQQQLAAAVVQLRPTSRDGHVLGLVGAFGMYLIAGARCAFLTVLQVSVLVAYLEVLLLYLLKDFAVCARQSVFNLFSVRCFRFFWFIIKWLCDEGINGKDQRAEKILLSCPTSEAKIKDRWWQTSVEAHHLMA
ncbi:unnamed protein product [Miscanthus lutarioriparius]|uniref:Uncharacterized protein n=1 Tax=Miscanthus lutarioriparius TaxID=422564 RepID=A0A811SMR4_9POAL|nr:unnamed protein product [Miscanthus lutarioriparius]